MPIFNYRLPARLFTFALMVAAPLGAAQTPDDSRWYKVEILVIAHTDRAALRAETGHLCRCWSIRSRPGSCLTPNV